ncbi:DNA-directed RNA polymerase III subunit RPC9-like [Halichondria panicea]|uniref:DNA-directed RNA polymerase III subunit RPC9-like n=1 Tax=Halichondria panicea TaxID=6063 RepID=UPI00312B4DAB
MEIIDKNVAMLSNFEVHDLLASLQTNTKGKKPNGRAQNLATITYETNEYLSKTPCALQDAKIIKDFLNDLKLVKLTKAEKLQLLNLRPVTQVELQLLVEEMEERLSEEETTALLERVAALPCPQPEQPEPPVESDTMDTNS